MYTITVWLYPRRKTSRKFKKKFNSLSEFAKYFAFSYRDTRFPYLDKELTERERIIVMRKLCSLMDI